MAINSNVVSQALFESLRAAPLLVNTLPEAGVFPLHTLTAPDNTVALNLEQKLGHLYEDALAVMLEHTPRYKLLAKNLQLREETGRTVGELDFLIRDHISHNLVHLELAVKFYLAVETTTGLLLPGPDARDNYYNKLAKMRSHQLLLSKKYHHLLPEEFREDKITVQHMVHGCIFNHIHATQPSDIEYLTPDRRHGKWLHASECAEFFGHDRHYRIIPKPLWPASSTTIATHLLEQWKPSDNIERCIMVFANGDNTPYFIAPNKYPY